MDVWVVLADGSSGTGRKEKPSLIFIYSGEYAVRVIRNLINDPSFCKPCGVYCDYCKYNVYTYVNEIRAAVELPGPSELPRFIDDPERYMPRRIPEADICVASELHKDLLLALPQLIQEAGVRALIVPVEDFVEVPSGLRKQLEEECGGLGLESAFPKPFCSLEPDEERPLISRFVEEFKVGRPKLEVSIIEKGRRETIGSTVVLRSAPCGSTWYVARKLLGVDLRREVIYDVVAKAHHSYPCTATMAVDPEVKEPILHIGGYIIREEVEKAIRKARPS